MIRIEESEEPIYIEALVLEDGQGPYPHFVGKLGTGSYWVSANCRGREFHMLVDTGAEVTILSHNVFYTLRDRPRLLPWAKPLLTANGKPIRVHGAGTLPIQLGSAILNCPCLVAEIKAPAILGIDAMEAFNCTISVRDCIMTIQDKYDVPLRKKACLKSRELSVLEDFVVPPRSEALVVCRVSRKSSMTK